MPRKPDLPSDSESAIPQLTRRAALRRGLLLGLGMATMIAVPACAAGGDGDEEDEGD